MVEKSFYLLSFLAVAMLLLLFRSYSLKKVTISLSCGLTIWISYLILLTDIGILRDLELPPKVPILVVIPAILFIFFLVNRNLMKDAYQNTATHIPIALQFFRVFVELLIYATYIEGIFPQKVTFEGMNFDVLVGISSIFVSVAVFKGKIKNNGILIWNLVSLAVLLLTIYSFISSYYFSSFAASGLGYDFVEFPYILLASVLLPIAIFLHFFSIKQVLTRKKVS
jgi:hypothetical protein